MSFQTKTSLLLITCCVVSVTTLKASDIGAEGPTREDNSTTAQRAAFVPEATMSGPEKVVVETDKETMRRVNKWLEGLGGQYIPVQPVTTGERWNKIAE